VFHELYGLSERTDQLLMLEQGLLHAIGQSVNASCFISAAEIQVAEC